MSMKKKRNKVLASKLAVLLLTFCVLAACTSSEETTKQQNNPSQSPSGEAPKQTTLTALGVGSADLDPLINGDPANTAFNKELAKRLGITLKYTMTTNEDYDTKLNLLISSGDAPDFFKLPSNYPGGASRAVQDGLILDLSKYLDSDLPNLKKILDAHPEYKKLIMTDEGAITGFPGIKESKEMTVFFGPMVRKDLLDKVNLPIPETMDDWHTMLTKFKEIGVKNPFTSLVWFPGYGGTFGGAYGTNGPGYHIVSDPEGKRAVYAPAEPGYMDYMATMHQWYKEGLIDPDFVTLQDWGVLDTKVISGDSAATIHFLSNIVKYTEAGKATDPNFEMVAVPNPVLKKGDKPYLGQANQMAYPLISVNANSKNLSEVLRFFDYAYSEEGQLLYNFGIEGESYTLDASGEPVYTDLIMKSPNEKGWSQTQSLGMYVPVDKDVPTYQAAGYFEQTKLANENQRDAVQKWSNATQSTLYFNVTTTEEETQVLKKLADIDTYVSEMTAKFIIGSEPLSNFDQYIEHLKSMGLDEIMAVQQAALDRYNNR